MTVVSDDPTWWPFIISNRFFSNWTVAAGVVVIYDWVLTLGQEIELIWRQRWSFVTVLYLVIRYIGIPYHAINVQRNMPSVSVTDLYEGDRQSDISGNTMSYAINGTNMVVAAMLGAIMITRLHAMYQRSRTMLIFLVTIFLAVNIACGIMAEMNMAHWTNTRRIDTLWRTYVQSRIQGAYPASDLDGLVAQHYLEVLALCLSVWIAVKHLRDLRRFGSSTETIIGDCLTVLIKSHVLYFASVLCVSCLELGHLSLLFKNFNPIGAQILSGACQIFLAVQMFVLGPRLILSVREYHAKLVDNSDSEASMDLIVFQERVHVPTSSTV
ncbi:hypothetical protein BDR07DRAFT_1493502 [Suillus spraguei]|nr:hypothetical protein BDR07DRAFT_1493502 [Suillus spraguei]